MSRTEGSIPSLDGWRALAISIVLLSHAGFGNLIPGGLGVTIFFFLSGYLITLLLIREMTASGTISLKSFFMRRFLRLMPPLLVTLFLCYLLTWLGITSGGISWQGLAAQVFYYANYYGIFLDPGNSTPTGTGIYWSLAVEEHFYFVFPLIFMAFYTRDRPARLILLLIATCVCVLLWRCYLVFFFHVSAERTYYATDTRIDSIVYGCLLAVAAGLPARRLQTLTRTMGVAVFTAAAMLLFTIVLRNPGFRETFRYSMQGAALAPLFYYSVLAPGSTPFRLLNTSTARLIGKYSYSIYLIHFFLLQNILGRYASKWTGIMVCIVLSIGYAFLIDRYIDLPMSALRRRFRHQHSAA